MLLAVVSIACSALFANDERNTTRAELKTVTVYRAGAEMGHTASATLKEGANELVIDNVSNQLDINSVRIKTPAAVTILGVEFSNNYLAPAEKSPQIRSLEDSLEQLQNAKAKLDLSILNSTDLLAVLKANSDIKGSQTGLTVAELAKLIDYYKTKDSELQGEIFVLREKKKKNDEQINKLQNQLREIQSRNITTSGRLILQLSVALAGKYDFAVSYIAQNAYWTPFYDVRADDIKKPLEIVYKGKVVQTTGIDWKQVKLSLSTSQPSQWGNAPALNSWFLAYIDPIALMGKNLRNSNMIENERRELANSSLDEVVVTGFGSGVRIRGSNSFNKSAVPLYVVNGNIMSADDFAKINPNAIKKMDVLKDAAASGIYGSQASNGAVVVELKDGLEDYVSVADNALNVTFDIDLPYDVPTNGKVQTAILQKMEVPAIYKHFTVPKLDKDAYLLAAIPGWGKLNLLPGDANIIVEGTYVGKSFIDPNSTSDTLNLTLGRDQRVSIKRQKLIDFSSVKFLGSNKLQKFTYSIAVKNNKKDPVTIEVKDQFPISTNKEIEVELTEAVDAEVNNETGVITWKITLAPGESRKLGFAFNVKYPKGKTLNWK